MSKAHAILKAARQVHLYIGIFIAPMLIFFAFTGALQTFSLHETTKGSDYKPPMWIVSLSQLHKNQTTVVPVRKPPPAPDAKPKADKPADALAAAPVAAPAVPKPAPPATPPPTPKRKSHLPMKIFFLFVSLGLLTSTLTGIYMAYKYGRSKLVVTLILLAGVVVPLALLPF